MLKILAVFGTRPEAIKMAPVIAALRLSEKINLKVCVTGQHKEILNNALNMFGLVPDYNLNLMERDQALDVLTARILIGIGPVLDAESPDVILVHGDTCTTMAVSLGAFYRKILVGHVEAGLRSGSLFAPWPEEMNRRITTLATRFHFAPTETARQSLLAEGVCNEHIHVTGNTVIDALLLTVERVRARGPGYWEDRFDFLRDNRRIILVTGHRRENFGMGMLNICSALVEIVERFDVRIVYPLHPNPNVKGPVEKYIGSHSRITLIEPLDYEPFVAVMDRAHFVITDSGGVQEEAPSLGKPVLVTREITERPEAVRAGTVRLVGTDRDAIVREAALLLGDPLHHARMAGATNPYGDGRAAQRIRGILEAYSDHGAF